MTAILGISAFYHDSAAALIIDGEIIAAAQEERFSRKKHDAAYPVQAIRYVLSEANIELSKVDRVVFYDKPFLKFERLIETYVAFAPKGLKSFSMAMPVWLREKLFLKEQIAKELRKLDANFEIEKLLFTEHHVSHAASAYYPSPFEEAIVLVVDGVGEWATTTVAIGNGSELNVVKEIHFPHSLGLLYSAVTYYTGFKVNSGEYKVMGLAPYGYPRFKDVILDKILDLKEDGSFRLDQSYFNYATGLTMTSKKFEKLFGEPVRDPEVGALTQFHMDMAASVQAVIEEVMIKLTRALSDEYGIKNLCMAGGVALNCVANGKILKDARFANVWIQPASGDAGGSLGAALAVWYGELAMPRIAKKTDAMKGSYLGPEYKQVEIDEALRKCHANFEVYDDQEVIEKTAQVLTDGKTVGWFQGRMEFGPRSLGARSILADPRSQSMQTTLNLKIKFRESFRPFAPSVLKEDMAEWFEMNCDSPYMLLVAKVKKGKCQEMTAKEKKLFGIDKLNISRSEIPAVTHVDYSARVQSVHEETNPKYYKLLKEFKKKTGCPVLANTSFNVRGEPIVLTVQDAFNCFMGTGLDILVIGNAFLTKEKQTPSLVDDYKNKYNPD